MIGMPLGLYLAFKQHINLHGLWFYGGLRKNRDLEVEKATERVEAEERARMEEFKIAAAEADSSAQTGALS
ncbi:hypothetical protein D9613_011624 [Agrocybe pediades]|uniref:Uncharacterized protein n=1 Tax=Agrocybe pediades TaxID=84607 RepID=A0A8H4VS24_9AGAR|nr:hypothetical protein D9613_011624 [Agrocybe pediades]